MNPGIADVAGGLGTIGNVAIGAVNAYQNYQNYEYMKEVQEKTWEREDTAAQRAVADLRAAGLSPTLAAGHFSPTSSPVRLEAPQVEMNPMEIVNSVMGLSKMKADISKTNAETRVQDVLANVAEANQSIRIERERDQAQSDEYKRQIDSVNAHYQDQMNFARLQKTFADTSLTGARYNQIMHDLNLSRKYGVRTTDHDKLVQYMIAGSGIIEDLFQKMKDVFGLR